MVILYFLFHEYGFDDKNCSYFRSPLKNIDVISLYRILVFLYSNISADRCVSSTAPLEKKLLHFFTSFKTSS